MKFKGSWNDPISTEPDDSPSPIFQHFAEFDVLKEIINRANKKEDENEGEEETNLRNWLAQLKKEIDIDGFGKAFVHQTDCVILLLKCLGVDWQPNSKALLDPFGSLVAVFSRLFLQDSVKGKIQAIESGVIDRMLLRLGELQAEEPRRPAHVRRHQIILKKEVPPETVPNAVEGAPTIDVAAILGSNPNQQLPSVTTPPSGFISNTNNNTMTQGSWNDLKTLWRPGYGTGEANANNSKLDAERESNRLEKIRRSTAILDCLTIFLDHFEISEGENASVWNELLDSFDASCLLRVTMSSFYEVTVKALVENVNFYTSLLQLVAAIARKPRLAPLIGEVSGVYKPLFELLRSLRDLAQSDLLDEEDDGSKKLLSLIESTASATDKAVSSMTLKKEQVDEPALEDSSSSTQNIQKIYEDALRNELFKDIDMRDPSSGLYSSHHFRSSIEDDSKTNNASKNRQRRLNRELKALRTTLPLHFGSSIALRIDRTRPFVGQFIIFAPENTPYDSGAFLFDFFCSADYPNEPPKVNLQTTGQGRVRFNPNLYQNGKVCLSLLGTWRGGATGSENWNAEHSSLYQVLVSIQSAILGSEYPYFNEPTVEALWGSEEGEIQKRIHPNGGYERLRVATIQYAMTSQIKNPPFGFEECIKSHFSCKREYIFKICDRWMKEAEMIDSRGHLQSLKEAVDELKLAYQQYDTKSHVQEEQDVLNTKMAPEELPEAVEAKLKEEIAFLKDMHPNHPDSVFREVLINTARRDGNHRIVETDFLAAIEAISKMSM